MHALANVATHPICGQHDCASVSLILRPGAVRRRIRMPVCPSYRDLELFASLSVSHKQPRISASTLRPYSPTSKRVTFPTAKRSARSKKPHLAQTTALCTLCVSGPHMILRSEYLPDVRRLCEISMYILWVMGCLTPQQRQCALLALHARVQAWCSC
jgi:hypothetical protein